MCGKISKLIVKYPLSQNMSFLKYFLLWAGLSDEVDMGTMVWLPLY